jgi:hypothetical protein
MHSTPALAASHLRTYETIFQHPISHNLEWRAVHALFGELGHIVQEPNGNFKVTLNGQTLCLNPPRTKDVANADEVMNLRHFLQRSEAAQPATDGNEMHWLLVIDHHEARIFRSEMHGAEPQQIFPYSPEVYFRHAKHSDQVARGKEKPEPNSFFEPVANAMHGAGSILVFGTGTGTSSEMEQFVTWTRIHHPELTQRIIGSLTVNERHLTDDQLLARAREFYATNQVSSV